MADECTDWRDERPSDRGRESARREPAQREGFKMEHDQELPHWAHELKRRVGRLEQRMDRAMAQIDDLNNTLDAISTDVGSEATRVAALEDEIKQLQAQVAAGQPIDLTATLEKATAIRERLEGIADTAGTAASSSSSSGTDSSTGAAPASGDPAAAQQPTV